MVSLLISRKVLRQRVPCVREFLVERVRTRQDVISGVYNGEPGLGFKRARYYVSMTFETANTFFSTLFAWNI